MKKLRILIDLDDTMEEFLPRWIQAINYQHNRDVRIEDVRSWHMNEVYPDLLEEDLIEPLLTYEFWEGVREKPGAAKNILKFINDGHQINVVTSSHYGTIERKMDSMFFRLFPFLTWSSVIVTNEKGRIKGDVLIDDNPDFMEGFTGLRLLMDAPHNQGDMATSCATRVYNWNEVYDVVTSYAESVE